MKIIRIILIALTALVIALIAYSLTLPEEITIKRSIKVNATQDFAYKYISDLRNWEKWTPWKEYDSTLTYEYSENTVGKGAVQTWDGEESQKASLEITDVKEPERVDFILKWQDGDAAFKGYMKINKLKDRLVEIDWVHYNNVGWNPFMRLLGSMLENMMGPNFEKGLKKLKTKVEHNYNLETKSKEFEEIEENK